MKAISSRPKTSICVNKKNIEIGLEKGDDDQREETDIFAVVVQKPVHPYFLQKPVRNNTRKTY